MSNFAQPVSMYCPSKEDYERDLQQALLDLGYEEQGWGWNDCGFIIIRDGKIIPNQSSGERSYHFIPTYNHTLAIAIAAMRVGEEIHVGEYVILLDSVTIRGSIDGGLEKGGIHKVVNIDPNDDTILVSQSDGKDAWLKPKRFRKATLQELIDKFGEKEFVLPEKWRINVTVSNMEMLSKWRGTVTVSYGWITEDKWHILSDKYIDEDERIIITTQQFIDHVYTPWLKSQEPAPFVPKRGDVVYCSYTFPKNCSWVSLVSAPPSKENPHVFDYLCMVFIEKNFKGDSFKINGYQNADLEQFRLATDSEKQLLFDALAKQGKRYNEKEFCIEDIPVNPHQSMIDEWEASGRTKIVQRALIIASCQEPEWFDDNNPTWEIGVKYRFKPEEPKESVPARPVMVKAVVDSPEKFFFENKVYKVAKCSDDWNKSYGYDFHAIGEDGREHYCLEKGCAHMNHGDWLVLQREGEPEPQTEIQDQKYPLFKHMSDEHRLTLLDSELQEIENIVLGKIIEDDYYRGFGAAEKPKDIPSFAKILAQSLVDETTNFKEAFRLLELVRQEVEQIRQETIATKTKERDKLTAEIKKLKQSQNK